MSSLFIIVYVLIAVFLGLFDIYYGIRAYNKSGGNGIGRFLGYSGILGGIVTLSYMCSIWFVNYKVVSASSSIYFIGIDWMLVSLAHFVYVFTESRLVKRSNLLLKVALGYAVFDTIVLIVNIFHEISVHYVYRAGRFPAYDYQMMPLYRMHLLYTYLLVVMVIAVLVNKAIKTPEQYRDQYLYNIFAIMLVVLINAVFLFPEEGTPFTTIDHSVIGYSLALYLMFWATFDYRYNNMLKALSLKIIENIDQGIVLFDHEDEYIMNNIRAERMLGGVEFREDLAAEEFLEMLGLPVPCEDTEKRSMQCSRNGKILRCDYTCMKDKKGRVTGSLYAFTDTMDEIDILTGFQEWEPFKRFVLEKPENFSHPTSVVVFDLNGLGEINYRFGREEGDRRMRMLANALRKHMPEDSYFVRGYDAYLLAVCYHYKEEDILEKAEAVASEIDDAASYGIGETAEGEEPRDLLAAIDLASHTLQAKKLLNSDSAHSQTLTSLVRALQESDSETEAHVQRTQKMGELLGQRVGLSDSQQADLNLLCLLHDIGKIGIPLEILNKPGRLTEEEWVVLRTHPEKGYQIAMSSNELKHIAPMILSHHERWDGFGYPQGLVAEEIPILSRIIAIIDAYDAMVNDRAYRRAMSPEKAQEEIKRCSGSQFDPFLASEFLTLLEETPEIATGDFVDGAAIRVFHQDGKKSDDASGSSLPVYYSRYLLDHDEMIVEVDDNFCELTGYTTEEAVGMCQNDLIPPESRVHYISLVEEQFRKGNVAFIEHEIMCKDGSRLQVLCIGKRYYDSAVRSYRAEIVITRKDNI